MKKASIISFDQDWASDAICNYVSDLLIDNQIKSTWFITNDSPFLDKLRQHKDLFELGIHPNFLKGSTHGNEYTEVLSHMKQIVPEALISRSHGVFQNGQVLNMMRNSFDIKCDLTMFEYLSENIKSNKLLTSVENHLIRLPVFWADDHEFNAPESTWDLTDHDTINGIKVFSFHPVHVYLNSRDTSHYELFKKNVSISGTSQIDQYINTEKGSKTALLSLINKLSSEKQYFIKEILDLQNG